MRFCGRLHLLKIGRVRLAGILGTIELVDTETSELTKQFENPKSTFLRKGPSTFGLESLSGARGPALGTGWWDEVSRYICSVWDPRDFTVIFVGPGK